jgi:antitoxin MazE
VTRLYGPDRINDGDYSRLTVPPVAINIWSFECLLTPRRVRLTAPFGQEYPQCIYMAISTQIAKWGNSLGLRLPKSVALEAQLDEGDTVSVSVKDGAIVVRPARPTYSVDALVAKITKRNRHEETDWGTAPAGHELW